MQNQYTTQHVMNYTQMKNNYKTLTCKDLKTLEYQPNVKPSYYRQNSRRNDNAIDKIDDFDKKVHEMEAEEGHINVPDLEGLGHNRLHPLSRFKIQMWRTLVDFYQAQEMEDQFSLEERLHDMRFS